MLELHLHFLVRARGDLDAYCKQWCLEPATHDAYLKQVGADRLKELRRRLDEADLPEEVRKEANRELNRLERLPAAATRPLPIRLQVAARAPIE